MARHTVMYWSATNKQALSMWGHFAVNHTYLLGFAHTFVWEGRRWRVSRRTITGFSHHGLPVIHSGVFVWLQGSTLFSSLGNHGRQKNENSTSIHSWCLSLCLSPSASSTLPGHDHSWLFLYEKYTKKDLVCKINPQK